MALKYSTQGRSSPIHPSLQVSVSRFVSQTYFWMFIGLALTGFSSLGVLSSETLIRLILGNSWVLISLVILEVALVFGMGMMMNRANVSAQTLTLSFILYSIVNGLTFSSIGLVYTGESIAQTFFIASGMFGGLAAFGTLTQKDLSPIGSFFGMGLIGIILLSVVNLFVGSNALSMGISTVGVIVFAGLTAYDAQAIRNLAWSHVQANNAQMERKAIIMGALMLYLDFINLFLYLLKLLGKRRSD